MSEDDWGCAAFCVLLVVGGAWAYNHYEIRKIDKSPTTLVTAPPLRPTGIVDVTTTEEGSRWTIDADRVTGNRTARMGWLTMDHSADKTEKASFTKELYLVDCNTTAARVVSFASYGKGGKLLFKGDYDPAKVTPSFYPPHTTGDSVVRELCRPEYGQ